MSTRSHTHTHLSLWRNKVHLITFCQLSTTSRNLHSDCFVTRVIEEWTLCSMFVSHSCFFNSVFPTLPSLVFFVGGKFLILLIVKTIVSLANKGFSDVYVQEEEYKVYLRLLKVRRSCTVWSADENTRAGERSQQRRHVQKGKWILKPPT